MMVSPRTSELHTSDPGAHRVHIHRSTDPAEQQYIALVRGYSADKLLRHLAMAREFLDREDSRRVALEAELELRLS